MGYVSIPLKEDSKAGSFRSSLKAARWRHSWMAWWKDEHQYGGIRFAFYVHFVSPPFRGLAPLALRLSSANFSTSLRSATYHPCSFFRRLGTNFFRFRQIATTLPLDSGFPGAPSISAISEVPISPSMWLFAFLRFHRWIPSSVLLRIHHRRLICLTSSGRNCPFRHSHDKYCREYSVISAASGRGTN